MQRTASVVRFSTASVPAGSADDAWRQITSPTYETSRRPDHDAPLSGAITSLPVGDMLFGRTAFGPQAYARTRHVVADSGLDCYLVQLFQVGGLVLHEGTGVAVGAGDIVVNDLARQFAASTDGGATVSVMLPRELLGGAAARRGSLHGTVWRAGAPLTRLLAGYLDQLDSVLLDAETPDDATLASIRESTAAVLDTMLSPSAASDAARALRADESLRDRIEAYIEADAANPLLSPDLVAEHFAISRSTLYRLFDDGVASLIRDRRLDAAHRRLAADASARVSEVAHDVGMPSARTFTRAFRHRFGVSPSAVRDRSRRVAPITGAVALHDVFARVGARYSALTG